MPVRHVLQTKSPPLRPLLSQEWADESDVRSARYPSSPVAIRWLLSRLLMKAVISATQAHRIEPGDRFSVASKPSSVCGSFISSQARTVGSW